MNERGLADWGIDGYGWILDADVEAGLARFLVAGPGGVC
jgi:hypothetical protein